MTAHDHAERVPGGMRPEDVPAELVEKAARAMRDEQCTGRDHGTDACPDRHCRDDRTLPFYRARVRHALAAVLPEIQAQALEEAADTVTREVGIVWPPHRHTDIGEAASYAAEVLRANARAAREGKPAPYAARLTTTTEEPT